MHGLGSKTTSSMVQEAVNCWWLVWYFGTAQLHVNSVLVLFPKHPILAPVVERNLAGRTTGHTCHDCYYIPEFHLHQVFLSIHSGVVRRDTLCVFGGLVQGLCIIWVSFLLQTVHRPCASPPHEVGIESTECELVAWMDEQAGGKPKKAGFQSRDWRMKDTDV